MSHIVAFTCGAALASAPAVYATQQTPDHVILVRVDQHVTRLQRSQASAAQGVGQLQLQVGSLRTQVSNLCRALGKYC